MAAELYSAAQLRELDRRAIEVCGIPGYALMQRAASAAWAALRDRWPRAQRITLVCGHGNNGGDGYEIARLALAAGCTVRVFELDDVLRRGDAATARAAWLAQGAVEPWADGSLVDAEVIVDAIFGIGLSRAPTGEANAAIAAINAAHADGAGVLAVDIPSGLMADTGTVPGIAIEADLTVTFIGRKFGLHTAQGPAHTGLILLDGLAIPAIAYAGSEAGARLLHRDELQGWLPRRKRTAHKGDSGHVLLIGGDHGMAGAILIAARAALRGGAGLVTVATRSSQIAALAAAQPEIMFQAADSPSAFAALLDRADVIAIGPGLGQHDWGRRSFELAVTAQQPMVVDADALNLLAGTERYRDDWVLTPHPGEAGRLLGMATAEVQADRATAIRRLHDKYGGAVVLKGAGSLVLGGGKLSVCPYGNPGMGVGGMGDALTGIVAAFIAQGLTPDIAAAAAVTAHALAGDLAAQTGERGMAASDLIDRLREIVKP